MFCIQPLTEVASFLTFGPHLYWRFSHLFVFNHRNRNSGPWFWVAACRAHFPTPRKSSSFPWWEPFKCWPTLYWQNTTLNWDSGLFSSTNSMGYWVLTIRGVLKGDQGLLHKFLDKTFFLEGFSWRWFGTSVRAAHLSVSLEAVYKGRPPSEGEGLQDCGWKWK